jgi:hypothetical protein
MLTRISGPIYSVSPPGTVRLWVLSALSSISFSQDGGVVLSSSTLGLETYSGG